MNWPLSRALLFGVWQAARGVRISTSWKALGLTRNSERDHRKTTFIHTPKVFREEREVTPRSGTCRVWEYKCCDQDLVDLPYTPSSKPGISTAATFVMNVCSRTETNVPSTDPRQSPSRDLSHVSLHRCLSKGAKAVSLDDGCMSRIIESGAPRPGCRLEMRDTDGRDRREASRGVYWSSMARRARCGNAESSGVAARRCRDGPPRKPTHTSALRMIHCKAIREG